MEGGFGNIVEVETAETVVIYSRSGYNYRR